jgi:hypothetical protein
MSKPTAQEVILAVGHLLTDAPEVTWEQIVSHIKLNFTVKNWLTEVRGPMQWLINTGYLHRIPDVHTERYALGKA